MNEFRKQLTLPESYRKRLIELAKNIQDQQNESRKKELMQHLLEYILALEEFEDPDLIGEEKQDKLL